jgi:hypothetical protein
MATDDDPGQTHYFDDDCNGGRGHTEPGLERCICGHQKVGHERSKGNCYGAHDCDCREFNPDERPSLEGAAR